MKLKKVNSWEDLTLEQFLALKAVDPLDVDTSTGLLVKKASIISGCTEEEVEEVDLEELTVYALEIRFTNEDPKEYKKRVGKYKLKNFRYMTIGEFITLDSYVSKDYVKNAPKIISILYRRTKINEFGTEELEPLGKIDIDERAEEMLQMKAGSVFGAVLEFLEFRENFVTRYASFFEGEDDEDDEGFVDEELTEAERRAEEREEKLRKKWAWHITLHSIAEGDLTKMEDVTELELEMVFQFRKMEEELKLKK